MSSATETYGGGGGTPLQNYFCYECDQTVAISPAASPDSELVCPNCNGGFLEESDTAAAPTSPPAVDPGLTFGGGRGEAVPLIFSGPGGGEIDLSALFGGAAAGHPNTRSPNEFNPFAFLNNYISNLRDGGADIQFVFEGPGGGGSGGIGFGGRMSGNLGDYFMGPGLEQLIQQLADNDPNRYGTPPAAKSAVEGLPDVMITEEMLASDSSQCAVCKDCFELDVVAKQMPCKHIYHSECIMPWLELHNSCPVCRYELPTDDTDYENRRNGQGQGQGQGRQYANSNNDINLRGSTVNLGMRPLGNEGEGGFRIQLPFGFRGWGSRAETSGSGGAGDPDESGGFNVRASAPPGANNRMEDVD